ncbi:hypothetical protein [Paraburkholderia bryophila]|uniref:Uncharacterized protein n=1 Tax=Paraburkholderia bryophila TaxID=420952 RepID=A0A7Z0BB99_9BURK|nr:hypothetical protein [Paraburkholderia bryophila]NYH26242.1 hypothetical protein [Paraburkholderia bryophila]
MARNKLITIILGSLLLVMLALVIAFNVLNLQEAYGGGPPHYNALNLSPKELVNEALPL